MVRAAPEPLAGELCKPALHEVHPGAVGRREMEGEAGMALEPALDGGRAVRGDVVEHDMHRQLTGNAAVDEGEEPLELPSPVPGGHLRDHVSRGDIERCVEVRRAVTDVVVRLAAGTLGIIGNIGAVRSSAWTWVFSSTHSTTAASGGLR